MWAPSAERHMRRIRANAGGEDQSQLRRLAAGSSRRRPCLQQAPRSCRSGSVQHCVSENLPLDSSENVAFVTAIVKQQSFVCVVASMTPRATKPVVYDEKTPGVRAQNPKFVRTRYSKGRCCQYASRRTCPESLKAARGWGAILANGDGHPWHLRAAAGHRCGTASLLPPGTSALNHGSHNYSFHVLGLESREVKHVASLCVSGERSLGGAAATSVARNVNYASLRDTALVVQRKDNRPGVHMVCSSGMASRAQYIVRREYAHVSPTP
ncbi:hypothetical protein MTO96_005836 [Rhipicephalus appendiculatus]